MKKLFSISILLILAISTFAQLPQKKKVYTCSAIYDNQQAAQTFSTFNATFADTIKSGSAADTVFFKVLINHVSIGFPYLSLNTKLVSAGQDTTATLTFWQSIDGSINWQQIKQVLPVVTEVYDTTKVLGLNGSNLIVLDTTAYAKGFNGKFDLLYKYKSTYKGLNLYSASLTTVPTEAVWSISIAKGTGGTDVSFWRQSAKFEGQYLGIRIIAPTRTGHKTIYSGTVKFQKAN